MATKEFFPGIEKIKFEGKDSKNPMAFRHYDAQRQEDERLVEVLYGMVAYIMR